MNQIYPPVLGSDPIQGLYKYPKNEVWTGHDGVPRLLLRRPHLARKLNKLIGYYPPDTKFQAGEEYVFRVPREQLHDLLEKLHS